MARDAPHNFLRLGTRWVNMSLVTDIEELGDSFALFVTADMARMAGRGDEAVPLDVARRILVEGEEEVHDLREWLKLNAE